MTPGSWVNYKLKSRRHDQLRNFGLWPRTISLAIFSQRFLNISTVFFCAFTPHCFLLAAYEHNSCSRDDVCNLGIHKICLTHKTELWVWNSELSAWNTWAARQERKNALRAINSTCTPATVWCLSFLSMKQSSDYFWGFFCLFIKVCVKYKLE